MEYREELIKRAFDSNAFVTTDQYATVVNPKIWDTDFHSLDPSIRIYEGDSQIISKSVLIKESAFIGANSIILKGVTIGKNSIVGAGSVVSKNIPDNEIWAGNPVRFIKKLNKVVNNG